jgi:hypothetical protein
MRLGTSLRVAGVIVTSILGVLLYAGLISMHQIYPITEATINKAPDEEARQYLVAERNKRNAEERREKGFVGMILVIDALAFLWMTARLLRSARATVSVRARS